MRAVKVASLALIFILVLNLILLGTGRIRDIFFWAVIGICGILSYFINKQSRLSKKTSHVHPSKNSKLPLQSEHQ